MQRAKRDIKAAASPDALKQDTQATDVLLTGVIFSVLAAIQGPHLCV